MGLRVRPEKGCAALGEVFGSHAQRDTALLLDSSGHDASMLAFYIVRAGF